MLAVVVFLQMLVDNYYVLWFVIMLDEVVFLATIVDFVRIPPRQCVCIDSLA